MSWTAPRTFVTGEIETAAIFNTHLRDNMLFLKSGVALSTAITASSGNTVGTTELVVASQAITADGTTAVELSYSWYNVPLSVTTDIFFIRLYDGATAGSGTQLSQYALISAANAGGGVARTIITPSAGAHTYTARLVRASGTGVASVTAGTTSPGPALISIAQFN